MVIACGALDEAAMNQLCRERGVYAHHVSQWKQDCWRRPKSEPLIRVAPTQN